MVNGIVTDVLPLTVAHQYGLAVAGSRKPTRSHALSESAPTRCVGGSWYSADATLSKLLTLANAPVVNCRTTMSLGPNPPSTDDVSMRNGWSQFATSTRVWPS